MLRIIKKITLKTVLFIFFICAGPFSFAQEFSAMSYNIKYDNVSDTVNNWNDRKEAMVKLITHYKTSFVGMQEVLHNQVLYLNDQLPFYTYVGVGRDDGKQKGEYSPIFYNTNEFTMLTNETFWLSTTPEVISVGWDASMERICTYGLFEHTSTKQKILVFNTHFDHIGKEARNQSAKLIARKIMEISKTDIGVVLMGDLNLPPESSAIQFLKQQFSDGQSSAKNPIYGPSGTFSGFDHNKILDTRIDYIFTDKLQVDMYLHIDDRMENNKHISDHLPVLARLKFIN